MCMPLFWRLRALSLKHFCSPPHHHHYVWHYVHTDGGKETEGTECLKYTTSALLFPIGLKTRSFEVHVVFRRVIYARTQLLKLENKEREYKACAGITEQMHAHTQSLIIVIGFKQNTFQRCVRAHALCWQSAVGGAWTDPSCLSGDYGTLYLRCMNLCVRAGKETHTRTLAIFSTCVSVWCRPAEAWKTALIPFQSIDCHTDDPIEELCVCVCVCVFVFV